MFQFSTCSNTCLQHGSDVFQLFHVPELHVMLDWESWMTTYMPEDRHRWFDLRKFHSWSTEGEVSLRVDVMLYRWAMGLISRPHSGLIFIGWHVAQYCWAFCPLNISALHCLKMSCTSYSAMWHHVSGEWRP